MKCTTRLGADFSLLMVALVWGATFVVVKWAVADLPPFPFLAIRFALAFFSLLPFIKWRQLSKPILMQGFGIGIFLFSGYAWQTIGLQYTSAANAGFITGLSVVFVPALVTITTKTFPRPNLLVGIFCALVGLALLSLGDDLRFNHGDLFILICALSFTLHIFFVGRFAPGTDAALLTAVQIFSVSVLSALASLVFPQPAIHFTPNAWLGLLLTAIPATSLAFFIQTKMQQFTSPAHTALIFACEPVFAAVFAFFLAGETLTTRGLWGAGLVLAGMLISEFAGAGKTQNTPCQVE